MTPPDNAKPLGGAFRAGDSLRGLAVLWVVMRHVSSNAVARTTPKGDGTNLSDHLGLFGQVMDRALFAVFIFFGLSGYLLGRPYMRSLIFDRPLPRTRTYLRNRVLRIVPVFWLAVLATLIVRGRRGEGWSEVLVVPLFAQIHDPSRFSDAIPQAWTLDVEAIFYLALPLVAWIGAKLLPRHLDPSRRMFLLLAFILAGAAASIYIRNGRTTYQGLISMPSIWFSFAAGVAIACVEPRLRDHFTDSRRGRAYSTVIALVGAGALMVYIWVPSSLARNATMAFIAVSALLSAALILQWATGECWRWLDTRPARWLGERSYSLYVWHVLVIYVLSGPVPEYRGHPWLSMLALLIPTLAISLLVSWFSFRYVERPLLKRKHVWAQPT